MFTQLFDWLLGSLPDYVIICIIAFGALLFLIDSFSHAIIPLLYSLVIRVLAITMFAGGFYLQGRQDILIRGKEIVEKIVIQEKIVTQTVVEKYKDKQKQIGDNHGKIITIIDTNAAKTDSMCTLPQSFVSLHNHSADNTVPGTSEGTDETPAKVTLSDAERTIADNYTTYNEVASQLESLQEWVKKQKDIRP